MKIVYIPLVGQVRDKVSSFFTVKEMISAKTKGILQARAFSELKKCLEVRLGMFLQFRKS